jgi:ABC-type multidrug transport system ATPase subunit
MSMAEPMAIVAEGLCKRFSRVQAVSDVDLQLPEGRVLALLGPNGAGKTTTARMLTTLIAPDHGWARVAGHDVVKEAGAVRRRIGLSGQSAALDAYLSGAEFNTLQESLRPRARTTTAGGRLAPGREEMVNESGLAKMATEERVDGRGGGPGVGGAARRPGGSGRTWSRP